MSHDPCCPLDSPEITCVICEAIATARAQEKDAFNSTWKANLGPITQRAYERGYRDAVAKRTSDWTRW